MINFDKLQSLFPFTELDIDFKDFDSVVNAYNNVSVLKGGWGPTLFKYKAEKDCINVEAHLAGCKNGDLKMTVYKSGNVRKYGMNEYMIKLIHKESGKVSKKPVYIQMDKELNTKSISTKLEHGLLNISIPYVVEEDKSDGFVEI